jgi:hypothetical protein
VPPAPPAPFDPPVTNPIQPVAGPSPARARDEAAAVDPEVVSVDSPRRGATGHTARHTAKAGRTATATATIKSNPAPATQALSCTGAGFAVAILALALVLTAAGVALRARAARLR